jgi:hypothetical protein
VRGVCAPPRRTASAYRSDVVRKRMTVQVSDTLLTERLLRRLTPAARGRGGDGARVAADDDSGDDGGGVDERRDGCGGVAVVALWRVGGVSLALT